MANSRIVDADCHILEPPDIWQNHLGSKWQEKAPKLVKDSEGGDAWLTAVGGDPDPIGLCRHARDAVRQVPVARRDLRGGARRLLQRRGAAEGHGHRRCVGRDPVPAAAHDEPLPRRRGRRLRARGHRGVQQLPVRRVLRARPEAAGGHGPDPVDRHRQRGRRPAQGQGPRRQGRAHLELARRQRRPLARRRPVLGGCGRRGPARHDPHQHHQPEVSGWPHGRPRPRAGTSSTTCRARRRARRRSAA